MLTFQQRLRTQRDIRNVYTQGRRVREVCGSLFYIPTALPQSRIAIVVSKRVAKQAVVRNKLKRQFRSLFLKYSGGMQGSYDMILKVQPQARTALFEELEQQFVALIRNVH